MINVKEYNDGEDVVFASDVHFERTGRTYEKLSQLDCREKTELLVHMFRELEKVYGSQEVASKKMGTLLGWEGVN